MNWDVIDVKPAGPRVLAVKFSDGLAGTIRVDPAFCTGVFETLLDDELLKEAKVQHGVLVWPNGLDLAPDTMYREISSSPARHYEVGCHV